MIIPDVNLLVCAHNKADPEHLKAKAWWEELLNGDYPVGLPWICAMGFIRIVTHPRVLARPVPVDQAVAWVSEWIDQAPVIILEPGSRFRSLFLRFLLETGVGANLTTDAYLAALAVEHQAELHSHDVDFTRFAGLKWKDPLR